MNSPQRRAVFLDRDGTINEHVGYLDDAARFRIFPFAPAAVRRINDAGLLAIVVSNQSGVARGLFSEEVLEQIHERMRRGIQAAGGWLDAIYYCPHHPEAKNAIYRQNCACRKPAPGMIELAAARFGIELARSFLIGDRYLDVETAHRAGARGILVLTGLGREEWEEQRGQGPRQPDHVAENISDAVDWVLASDHAAQVMPEK